MVIRDDHRLKAACHGLLLGCCLPILAYSVSVRKWRNIVIYGMLAVYEIGEVLSDLSANS